MSEELKLPASLMNENNIWRNTALIQWWSCRLTKKLEQSIGRLLENIILSIIQYRS